MPGILTRRIGPFPGWVWGVIGGGGFLLFMYMRRQRTAAATGGQPTPVAIPQFASASGTIPYIPTGGVTGNPQPLPAQVFPGPPASAPTSPSVPSPVWQYGRPTGNYVWRPTGAPTGPQGVSGIFPGSGGDPASNPSAYPGFGNFSWQWAPVPSGSDSTGQPWTDLSYARALSSGGSGGWGYAGTGGLANPIGGWTLGWNPAPTRPSVSPGGGWGAGPSVNRTGAPRRARRLFGGSGGGSAVNRTGARATRPLRRRSLSGR